MYFIILETYLLLVFRTDIINHKRFFVTAKYYLFLQDMDLIEVLWKQDVDLGFSLEVPGTKNQNQKSETSDKLNSTEPTTSIGTHDDDLEKLKTLKALNSDNIKVSSFQFVWIYVLIVL